MPALAGEEVVAQAWEDVSLRGLEAIASPAMGVPGVMSQQCES